MKIVFESKKGIEICRIVGKINKKSADELLESFEKTAKGLSVLMVLDQVSEIDGAGFQALSKIFKLVKKMVFCCSLANKQLQGTLKLGGLGETYQLFQTESVALSELQTGGD